MEPAGIDAEIQPDGSKEKLVMLTFRFANRVLGRLMLRTMNCTKAGLVVLTGILVISTAGPVVAFDPLKVFKSDENPRAIMKYAFDAYKKGRKDEAVGAFRYAAEKNQLAAKWKLGRMYAIGDGVKRSEIAAFKLYREIADDYSKIRPKRQDRIFVSSATVAVADYYRSGISGTNIKPNIKRAVDYYIRAGALYGNGHAQYQLGRIYLDGKMGKSQPLQAARWLRAAGKKKHPAAQAVLGRMLYEGNGVRRRRVQGLMLMTLAVGNSARSRLSDKLGWINEWREKAFDSASSEERVEAVQMADRNFASSSKLKDHAVVNAPLLAKPVSLLPDK